MDRLERICETVAGMAMRSVIYEVTATPKPGLVDRANSGAHRDMDFFTFIDSCTAISPYFHKMAQAGVNHDSDDLMVLFHEIRGIGIEAEKQMFQATNGINTHKGIIFSIGILSAAASYLMKKGDRTVIPAEELCDLVPLMVGDLCGELENLDSKDLSTLTHGEKLYLQYGFKGIRGEVEGGFQTVLTQSLPVLRAHTGSRDLNDVLVNTLLSLMVATDDSNILHRHDMATLTHVKECAREVLDAGGMFTVQGQKQVSKLDTDFIKSNISPGGAADLLAVTVFLGMMEGLSL